LSRIGQARDVFVFNLAAADTLEAAVLHLLKVKIAMFELVISEIDMILGNLDEEEEFEEVVTDLWTRARRFRFPFCARSSRRSTPRGERKLSAATRAGRKVVWRKTCAGIVQSLNRAIVR
jgi:hypothetical protein